MTSPHPGITVGSLRRGYLLLLYYSTEISRAGPWSSIYCQYYYGTGSTTVLAERAARVPVLSLFTYVLQQRLTKRRKLIKIDGVRAERARQTAREGREGDREAYRDHGG